MELTAENVNRVFMDCLFGDNENHDGAVLAEGVTMNVGFHPVRLKRHETEIHEMLKQLPDAFQKNGGGGMSFLEACYDKSGRHWAEHKTMQELFLLGIASGKAEYCLPRDLWKVLPGCMPYITVL
jgi:hypothetical protein